MLSIYPKQNRQRKPQIFNSNKILDDSGVFTILGLSEQDKFKEILKIHTKYRRRNYIGGLKGLDFEIFLLFYKGKARKKVRFYFFDEEF